MQTSVRIRKRGTTPVFVDVDPGRTTSTPDAVERALREDEAIKVPEGLHYLRPPSLRQLRADSPENSPSSDVACAVTDSRVLPLSRVWSSTRIRSRNRTETIRDPPDPHRWTTQQIRGRRTRPRLGQLLHARAGHARARPSPDAGVDERSRSTAVNERTLDNVHATSRFSCAVEHRVT